MLEILPSSLSIRTIDNNIHILFIYCPLSHILRLHTLALKQLEDSVTSKSSIFTSLNFDSQWNHGFYFPGKSNVQSELCLHFKVMVELNRRFSDENEKSNPFSRMTDCQLFCRGMHNFKIRIFKIKVIFVNYWTLFM